MGRSWRNNQLLPATPFGYQKIPDLMAAGWIESNQVTSQSFAAYRATSEMSPCRVCSASGRDALRPG